MKASDGVGNLSNMSKGSIVGLGKKKLIKLCLITHKESLIVGSDLENVSIIVLSEKNI